MDKAAARRLAYMTGRYIQQHADEIGEDEAQRKIAGTLQGWKNAMDGREGVMSRHDGSELRNDELRLEKLPLELRSSATKNDPLSHVTPAAIADHAIGTFHNLMRAFDSMVIGDDRASMRLHLSAEFVLIRALMEAATTALWLLGPDESDERITRALRLRRTELNFSKQLALNFHKHSGIDDDGVMEAQTTFIDGQMEDLVTMADRAGIQRTAWKQSATPMAVALGAAEYVPDLGSAVTYWYWSTASSIAHAEPANMYLLADLRFIGVDVRDEPVAHADPSASSIWKHLDVAMRLIGRAHELWNLRSGESRAEN